MSASIAERAQQEAARIERKFGLKAGATGAERFKLNTIPTGSLALDYALGTGGWPRGQIIEVYGPPDIGKSSVIGFNAIRNAQKDGLLCGIVAMEPNFDPDWAVKNGVDPEGVVVGRPDNGEEAFQMLHDWVKGDLVDLVIFDSIGAVIKESEGKDEGSPNVGGQSALITWGIKRILTPTWKNNKCVILLNQVRDNMKSRISGLVESPGGHALKHSATQRVQLKTTGSPFKKTIEGEEVVVGKTIVAVIERNKMNEGTKQRAEFDFYQKETDEFPVGIDWAKDVIATAIRSHVILKGGAWYRHPSFPGEEHRIQSKDKVAEFLYENPQALEQVRQDVLAAMIAKQKQKEKENG